MISRADFFAILDQTIRSEKRVIVSMNPRSESNRFAEPRRDVAMFAHRRDGRDTWRHPRTGKGLTLRFNCCWLATTRPATHARNRSEAIATMIKRADELVDRYQRWAQEWIKVQSAKP